MDLILVVLHHLRQVIDFLVFGFNNLRASPSLFFELLLRVLAISQLLHFFLLFLE